MTSSGLVGRLALVTVLVALTGGCSSSSPKAAPTTSSAACPTSVDASQLVDTSELRADNAFLADLGVRPTGSAAQQRYVKWIEKQLGTIDGVSITHHDFAIERTVAESATLDVRTVDGWQSVPVAAGISQAQGTPADGTTAPLVNIPEDQPITAELAQGRIVVRPAPPGEVPQSVFTLPLVTWSTFDPNHTIDPEEPFLGDFLNYNARVEDLTAAHDAGAAGILFVKDLDDHQLADHLEPYEGVPSPTPGVWLGADAQQLLDDAFAADPQPQARLVLETTTQAVTTRSVFATIPGASPARIVIDSHTDGTNVVEDNGPIAMVAMARYFAALPTRCRPRTIEFAF
ncbi:MAG TPA: hypothetical protein VFN21_09925, partial [Acidimicrobiales bacterium]|nr:hypothetical protein [Acidimicrobiales bacterium]